MTVVCAVPAMSSLFCCGKGPYSHLENSCPGQMEGADLLKHAGTGCAVSELVESAGAVLFPPGVHVSRLGVGGEGRKWHLLALWFLKKFPKDLCPFSTNSEVSKYISFLYTPAVLPHCCFCAVSPWAVCSDISLRMGTQFHLSLPALPELSALSFNIPG